MNSINIVTFILAILNAHFIHTEPNIREKRELKYSENVGNYYPYFNQPDNAITTVLPSLDSDGTSNVVNDVLDDDTLNSHWVDDGIHYFRDSTDNKVKTFSDPVPDEQQEISWNNENAPDNFMDIRGKKFFSFYPLRLYPKRAPSGFLGLRGKKYYFNGGKRVPSGFTGMRGKKSDFELYNNIDDNQGEFELPNDFSLYELLQKERKMLYELNAFYQMNQEMKNNPTFSFDNVFQGAEKRVPSGFLGMRGKKSTDTRNGYSGAKRAPSGFLGLRGKRDSIDDYNEGSKRGPFTSYLGMRGKKEPLVPERYQLYSRQDSLKWPLNELRTEINRTPPKRVPNGFLGVRGKKWTDTSNHE